MSFEEFFITVDGCRTRMRRGGKGKPCCICTVQMAPR